MMHFNPEKCAQHEIGWWRAHHEKDYDKVVEEMALLYTELFGLDKKKAKEIVMLRIQAAKEHDLAEKEGIGKEGTEQHWKKAEKLLYKHFTLLSQTLS